MTGRIAALALAATALLITALVLLELIEPAWAGVSFALALALLGVPSRGFTRR